MTRTIGNDLKTHLAGYTTTLALLVKITRFDSTEKFLTTHDANLTYDGDLYEAKNSFDETDTRYTAELSLDNKEISGPYNDAITRSDLLAGKYDNATVQIMIVNYEDLTQNDMKIFKGYIGNVVVNDNDFKMELLDFALKLQQPYGILIGAPCRADLFDSQCGLTAATYIKNATVLTVTSDRIFTISITGGETIDGYYSEGLITWTSGNNNGLESEIREHDYTAGTHTITLFLENPLTTQAGDTCTIRPGCNKDFFGDCSSSKYNNQNNHRGEILIPK